MIPSLVLSLAFLIATPDGDGLYDDPGPGGLCGTCDATLFGQTQTAPTEPDCLCLVTITIDLDGPGFDGECRVDPAFDIGETGTYCCEPSAPCQFEGSVVWTCNEGCTGTLSIEWTTFDEAPDSGQPSGDSTSGKHEVNGANFEDFNGPFDENGNLSVWLGPIEFFVTCGSQVTFATTAPDGSTTQRSCSCKDCES